MDAPAQMQLSKTAKKAFAVDQFNYVGSDLKKFVLDNEKDDPLVQGIPKKKNPYRDQKDCHLL